MNLPTIHQMPFLKMLLPMIVGILFYHLYPLLWPAYLLGGISLLFLSVPYLPVSTTQAFRLRYLFGIGICFIFTALGIYLSDRKADAVTFDFPKGNTVGAAEIISQPEEKEHSIACYLEVQENTDSLGEYKASEKQLSVYFHKDTKSLKLQQGDKVRFCAEVKPLVNTNRPGDFDYATYLNRHGICGTAYIDSTYWQKIPEERAFNLCYIANDLKNNIIRIFRSFQFGQNEFALLNATTIGYTDDLTQEQKGNFSAVGLSHLMAVSGMQTAMIFAMILFLLRFIPKSSRYFRIKFLVTLIVLWIFAFVTGLSPSVVRASIMLSVYLIGKIWNKQHSPFNSLAISAFCILLYNPLTMFDIGFQLSYAAVISILIAQAFFSAWIKQKKYVTRKGYNLILMTLAAQLGTSPLSIYYFHQFPLLFLIVNIIVLPLSGIQIYLSVVCLALASTGIPYEWLGYILEKMLWGLDYVTRYFSEFSFALIRDLNPSVWQIICYYLISIFCIAFLYRRKFSMLIYCLLMILILQGVSIYQEHLRNHTTRLMVYNQFGESKLERENKSEKVLYRTDKKYFLFEGKRIVLLNNDVRHLTAMYPLKSHFIILSKGFKGALSDLQKLYRFETIVLDASMSRYYSEKIEAACSIRKIPCHNIGKQGAFVYTITKN